MIITTKISADIKICNKEDLWKLKPLVEAGVMKVNYSEIARELSIDERTAKKYVGGFIKKKTKERTSKIDPFHDTIKELLTDTERRFFYKRVLYQYLVDNHGLKCSCSAFRRYINKYPNFREAFTKTRRDAPKDKAPMRVETNPGQQMQIDWKEDMIFKLKGGETITVNILSMLMSNSRFRVYRLSMRKTRDIVMFFLNDAFELIGGVPKEVVTDNMKTVMDQPRTRKSVGKVNNVFYQFSKDYGFEVKPCIAGRPNTKGKVEAPMKILDELFAYNGKLSYFELHKKLNEINERENSKLHPSTGKIPILHLQKEKDSLLPLPNEKIRNLYSIKSVELSVNPQSMIHHKSNQYSVPPEYMGKKVLLQVHDNCLHLYYNTKIIAIHEISEEKLNYRPEHYHEIVKRTFSNSDEEKILETARQNLKALGGMYVNQ
jgi:transposase